MSTAIRHFRYIGVEFVQTWKWVEPGPLEYTTDDTVEEALGTEHQDVAQQWILFKDISAYTRDSKLTQIVSFCNTRSQGHFWGERDSCGYSGLHGVDFFLVGSCSVFHSIPFRSFRWWPKRNDVFVYFGHLVFFLVRLRFAEARCHDFLAKHRLRPLFEPLLQEYVYGLVENPAAMRREKFWILVFRMTLDILHFYDILRWPMISFLFGRLVFCKCQSYWKYDFNKSLTMFGLSPLNWRCRMERRKHLWMSRHFCSPTCDDLTCTDSWRLGTIRDYSWLMTNVNLMRLLVTPWPWNNGAGSNRDGSMARELRRLKPWLTKNARN